MTRPAERVVIFYNHRGTAEQWIKNGKNAVTWTRLSCHSFKANVVRLQWAYTLANFLRTLAAAGCRWRSRIFDRTAITGQPDRPRAAVANRFRRRLPCRSDGEIGGPSEECR